MSEKIYLFDIKNQSFDSNNSLKEFLYYLKFIGKTGVIDFTYSNETDSLHHKLTIKENLLLDSVPISLIRDNELNLSEFIREISNPELILLVNSLGDLNQPISELCPRFLKLASLIKSILSKREYIFLVEPHLNLNQEDLDSVKKCLLYETEMNQRKVYIRTKTVDFWLDISSKIVEKNENFCYEEKENPFSKAQEPSNIAYFKKVS